MQENIKKENRDEDTIDLIDLVLTILRHWKLVFIVTILCGIGAFAFTRFMITPMYESTAQLFVLSKSTSITSLADIQMGSSLTNDYMIVVSGRTVLDQVKSNLGLTENYRELKQKISLNNPSNTRILNITVRDADPKKAKIIADEVAIVASAFISEKMDQDPPSIIQYGYDDGVKVSPSTTKNTLLGAVVGAMITMGLIVLIHLINDTIGTPDEVERKLGLKVIAQIPLEDSQDDEGRVKRRRNITL